MPTNSYVLVVGGAGYIGSHMVLALSEAGYQPLVLDNLSTGHLDNVFNAELIKGEMGNPGFLDQLFNSYPISAVMHFASFIEVGESIKFPGKYYRNNLVDTLNLLDVMIKHNVKNFIFSSSAAVYGEPRYFPMDELHPIAPINPYGRTKWMVEEIIKDYAASNHLNYAILRYFNAAGADPDGRLNERHEPESHLIPLVLQAAAGMRDNIIVYGNDYPTADGTCIRDYVHVTDICGAHLLALQMLCANEKNLVYNLGAGVGYSVLQVIDAARRITGLDIPVVNGPRRSGDPAILLASAALARRELGWEPKYSELDLMIAHSWHFMKTLMIS